MRCRRKTEDGFKGGESKGEEVFEEKDNQELEEQEEGEDNCPRVRTHQRQQNASPPIPRPALRLVCDRDGA